MDTLAPLAARLAERLVARKETLAVAEGSAGGLISATLLAVPGASAFFLGGAVIYTAQARAGLIDIGKAEMMHIRPATEAYAQLFAERIRVRLGATWGLGEAGAAGPTGNRYGDPAGHSCLAVAGPKQLVVTLRTGKAERAANMQLFAARALALLDEALHAAP